MLDLLLYFTYGYVTLEALFFVGAAVYCFRLTRITGVFRAWIMLIGALGLLAFVVLASYVRIIVFESPSALAAGLQVSTPTAIVLSSSFGIALSALLFFSMFEMFRTFSKARKRGVLADGQKGRLRSQKLQA